jgi:hypothetical protein
VLKPILSELKSAFQEHTEQIKKLAAAKLPRTAKTEALEGRCRQSVYPDGTVYWTFTWSRPEEGVVQPVASNIFVRSQAAHPESSEVIEEGRPQLESQHLVAAQNDPAEPRHAE